MSKKHGLLLKSSIISYKQRLTNYILEGNPLDLHVDKSTSGAYKHCKSTEVYDPINKRCINNKTKLAKALLCVERKLQTLSPTISSSKLPMQDYNDWVGKWVNYRYRINGDSYDGTHGQIMSIVSVYGGKYKGQPKDLLIGRCGPDRIMRYIPEVNQVHPRLDTASNPKLIGKFVKDGKYGYRFTRMGTIESEPLARHMSWNPHV